MIVACSSQIFMLQVLPAPNGQSQSFVDGALHIAHGDSLPARTPQTIATPLGVWMMYEATYSST